MIYFLTSQASKQKTNHDSSLFLVLVPTHITYTQPWLLWVCMFLCVRSLCTTTLRIMWSPPASQPTWFYLSCWTTAPLYMTLILTRHASDQLGEFGNLGRGQSAPLWREVSAVKSAAQWFYFNYPACDSVCLSETQEKALVMDKWADGGRMESQQEVNAWWFPHVVLATVEISLTQPTGALCVCVF